MTPGAYQILSVATKQPFSEPSCVVANDTIFNTLIFQICFSFFTQSLQTLVKMSKIQRKISILSATSTPWVIMLRRLNFPLKNKKGRKGESLALLQISF